VLSKALQIKKEAHFSVRNLEVNGIKNKLNIYHKRLLFFKVSNDFNRSKTHAKGILS
jgi:hypothetical protein